MVDSFRYNLINVTHLVFFSLVTPGLPESIVLHWKLLSANNFYIYFEALIATKVER